MAAPEPKKAPRNQALLVLVPMAIVLAIIASFATCLLWPRGQRVGTLDVTTPTSLDVDLKAGDTLSFRLDVIVGTVSGYPNSSRSRSNAVHEQLKASAVTLTLAQGSDPEVTTRCGAYDDKATTGSSSPDNVESSGLPLRCSLKAIKPGRHTLTASVAWVPEDVRKASLEVRRQRADD
jgi:hypothetical protein